MIYKTFLFIYCICQGENNLTANLVIAHDKKLDSHCAAPILNEMPYTESPPTFFRTNKFTSAFQALINAYGVATYRQCSGSECKNVLKKFFVVGIFKVNDEKSRIRIH